MNHHGCLISRKASIWLHSLLENNLYGGDALTEKVNLCTWSVVMYSKHGLNVGKYKCSGFPCGSFNVCFLWGFFDVRWELSSYYSPSPNVMLWFKSKCQCRVQMDLDTKTLLSRTYAILIFINTQLPCNMGEVTRSRRNVGRGSVVAPPGLCIILGHGCRSFGVSSFPCLLLELEKWSWIPTQELWSHAEFHQFLDSPH